VVDFPVYNEEFRPVSRRTLEAPRGASGVNFHARATSVRRGESTFITATTYIVTLPPAEGRAARKQVPRDGKACR
jgi:hypothetical protein